MREVAANLGACQKFAGSSATPTRTTTSLSISHVLSAVASPGFVARSGKGENLVMGHSR